VVLLRRQISLIGFAKIQNFSARHIEDALHMTLLNKRRHVEELIDTENISLPSQNMKFVGE
jgi:hypothetical protein